jgi:hypothetical protein
MSLPIDYNGLVALGNKVFDTVSDFLLKAKVPGIAAHIAAGVVTGLVMIGPMLIATVVQGVLGIGTFFAVQFFNLVATVRKDNVQDFNQVIAASMSELLGVEVSADDLPAGQTPADRLKRVQVIGSKLHDLLLSEFAPTGVVTPETGEKGARAFTGFGINFAVATSFIAILTESCSLGMLKEFRELGESLAQSLGLGRLQRLALQPLIRNTIQQPYDLYLRSKYRPDRLTDAQYVRAMWAGAFSETAVKDQLAQKGFPDPEIDRLIVENTPHLTEVELERLVRYGDMTIDDAARELVGQGIPDNTARRLLRNQELQRADAFITQAVNIWETQVFKGAINLDAFNKNLDTVPWTDTEKFWEKNYVANKLESPTHLLTLAQVKTGILQGILDFGYFDQWATSQGYDAPEALVLEYEILLAMDAQTTKEQAAAAAAARKAAKTA